MIINLHYLRMRVHLPDKTHDTYDGYDKPLMSRDVLEHDGTYLGIPCLRGMVTVLLPEPIPGALYVGPREYVEHAWAFGRHDFAYPLHPIEQDDIIHVHRLALSSHAPIWEDKAPQIMWVPQDREDAACGSKMHATYTATGDTYAIRDILKDAGFRWDADAKQWIGDEAAAERYGEITAPAWGRARHRRAERSGVVIEAVA